MGSPDLSPTRGDPTGDYPESIQWTKNRFVPADELNEKPGLLESECAELLFQVEALFAGENAIHEGHLHEAMMRVKDLMSLLPDKKKKAQVAQLKKIERLMIKHRDRITDVSQQSERVRILEKLDKREQKKKKLVPKKILDGDEEGRAGVATIPDLGPDTVSVETLDQIDAFDAITAERDHYAVLGIERSADQDEIRDAFIRLSKIYHPDLLPPEFKDKATKVFQRLNEAQSALLAAERTVQADTELESKQPDVSKENEREISYFVEILGKTSDLYQIKSALIRLADLGHTLTDRSGSISPDTVIAQIDTALSNFGAKKEVFSQSAASISNILRIRDHVWPVLESYREAADKITTETRTSARQIADALHTLSKIPVNTVSLIPALDIGVYLKEQENRINKAIKPGLFPRQRNELITAVTSQHDLDLKVYYSMRQQKSDLIYHEESDEGDQWQGVPVPEQIKDRYEAYVKERESRGWDGRLLHRL